MLTEIEPVSLAGLQGYQAKYEVQDDYYYEIELAFDFPEAYTPVDVLSIILRAESEEELAALENDINVAEFVKVL